jgi:hypothetical protein
MLELMPVPPPASVGPTTMGRSAIEACFYGHLF